MGEDGRDDPELHGGSLDERFEAILAHWDEEADTSGSARLELPDGTGAPRPQRLEPGAVPGADPGHGIEGDAEATDPDGRDGDDVTPEGLGPIGRPSWEAAALEDGWRRHTPPEVEEHFEPPDPQLPPAHDATYWLALVGLTLGPVLVFWAAALSGNPDPGWWVVLGVVATVGGFGLLVMRGSGERDPDDDGAVV